MKFLSAFFVSTFVLLCVPTWVKAEIATIPVRVLLSVGASSAIAELNQQVHFVAKTQNFQNLKKIDLYVDDQLAKSCPNTNVCGFLGGPYDNYPDNNFTYYAVGYEYSGLINETGRKVITIKKQKIPEAPFDLFSLSHNVPKIITPTNNETLEVAPRAARLSWTLTKEAVGYEVEHAYASGGDVHFTNPVYFSVTQNSIYLQDYLYGDGAFRYRVRALFSQGTFGNWSEYRYYTLRTPYEEYKKPNISITPSTFSPLEGERIKIVAHIKNREAVNTIKIYFGGELQKHCVSSSRCEADIGPFHGSSGRTFNISAEYFSEKGSGSVRENILVAKAVSIAPSLSFPEKSGHDFAKNKPRIVWGPVSLSQMYSLAVDCLSCKGEKKSDSSGYYNLKDTAYTITDLSTERESYRARVRALYPSQDGRSHYSPWSDFVYFVYGDNGQVNPHNVEAPFFQPSLQLVDEERKVSITADKVVVHENDQVTLTAQTVDKKSAQKIVISVNKKAEKTCTNVSICILTLNSLKEFSHEYVNYSAHLYTQTGFNTWTGYKKFKIEFSGEMRGSTSQNTLTNPSSKILSSPSILRPTNYDTLHNYPRVVYLAWSSVDSASSYEIEVYCKTCNTEEWNWKKKYLNRTESFSLPAFSKDDMYAVRVRAVSGTQVGAWSPFSYLYYETQSTNTDDRFVLPKRTQKNESTSPVLDEIPIVISPKIDEILKGKNLKPDFVWSPVYGAVKYEISVLCKSCTSDFDHGYNTWHFSTTDSYYRMEDSLRKSGTYVVQVRAVLYDGSYSPWSKQRVFEYIN